MSSEALSVLHVIGGLDPREGGPVAVVTGLSKAQAAAGMKVSVAASWRFQTHQKTVDDLTRAGVAVHMIGPARDPMSRYPGMAKILSPTIAAADIVHIHAMWESIQHHTARICQACDKPYVVTPHGMLSPWNLAQGRLKKRLYLALRGRRNLQRASAIHYTCEVERDLAARLKLHPPALVEALGIDPAEFADLPSRGTFRAKFPQIAERPFMLFLSRINYKKGLDILIPALARAQLPADTMLVIAGPDLDHYQPVVQKLIDENRLTERVLFTGMLSGRDRIEAIVDADVFVLPSHQENFGIVVIEALASGCPVIISDQVNIHPQITRDRVGEVVPARVDALSVAIERWMTDPALRKSTASRTIASVIPRQTWPAIAARWEAHYRRLLSCRIRAGEPKSR